MDTIKKHFTLFPTRLRVVLEKFPRWDEICEIRLRRDAPLSLTDSTRNLTLDEFGLPCSLSRGICCKADDLSYVLGSFCRGSVYRYFDRLQDGFAVDNDGWRMGICSEKIGGGIFLPEQIYGINLRIPRQVPFAAKPIVEKMEQEGLFSLLIFSPPGEGKTTVLRSLASMLSVGTSAFPPARVAVIDEKRELFPPRMKVQTGLLDLLTGYEKGAGIEAATRFFSPQIILCDEIGNEKDADSILNSCSGGCYVAATAHAGSEKEARQIPYLARLMTSGKFRYGLFLEKKRGGNTERSFRWEKFG